MLEVPHLEWHVTHSCNFTCLGCGHFTNDGYKQNFDLNTIREWYLLWNKKIRPRELSMLGGEPLLNKEIVDIIYMTKEVWNVQQDQELELVSNGLLFDKIPNLAKALKDTDCILTITRHSDDPNYVRLFEKSIECIKKSGVNYRIYNAPDFWIRAYNGYAENIEPIGSNNYKDSWDNCPSGQENFTLLNGKIYKCALMAYLPLQKEKYGKKLSSKWNLYLDYTPLSSTNSDSEIFEFFNRKAEKVCSLCPSDCERMDKPSPLYSPKYVKIMEESNREF